MAHQNESKAFQLLAELLKGHFGEPYRCLLQGGRLWSYDPEKLFQPHLPLAGQITDLSHLKLIEPGDCLISSVETSEIEEYLQAAGCTGYRLADWSQQPALSAEVWLKLIRDLPKDFYFHQAFERPRDQKGIFFDRDGVVLEAVAYLNDPQKVKLKAGLPEFMRSARAKGYKMFLITNQSGLGRGKITWSEFDQVQARMQALLAEHGQWFDDIEISPFFESAKEAEYLLWPEKRKPGSQMIFRLSRKHGVDLSKSILIGDRRSDLEAGAAGGIQSLNLLESPETASDSYGDIPFQYSILKTFSEVILD